MDRIPYQQEWNRSVHARYHCIAGPFMIHEATLFGAIRDYLTRTGARILTVGEHRGTSIYRLRSECETIEETAARLGRTHHHHGAASRHALL